MPLLFYNPNTDDIELFPRVNNIDILEDVTKKRYIPSVGTKKKKVKEEKVIRPRVEMTSAERTYLVNTLSEAVAYFLVSLKLQMLPGDFLEFVLRWIFAAHHAEEDIASRRCAAVAVTTKAGGQVLMRMQSLVRLREAEKVEEDILQKVKDETWDPMQDKKDGETEEEGFDENKRFLLKLLRNTEKLFSEGQFQLGISIPDLYQGLMRLQLLSPEELQATYEQFRIRKKELSYEPLRKLLNRTREMAKSNLSNAERETQLKDAAQLDAAAVVALQDAVEHLQTQLAVGRSKLKDAASSLRDGDRNQATVKIISALTTLEDDFDPFATANTVERSIWPPAMDESVGNLPTDADARSSLVSSIPTTSPLNDQQKSKDVPNFPASSLVAKRQKIESDDSSPVSDMSDSDTDSDSDLPQKTLKSINNQQQPSTKPSKTVPLKSVGPQDLFGSDFSSSDEESSAVADSSDNKESSGLSSDDDAPPGIRGESSDDDKPPPGIVSFR
eukprot:GHVL01026528.1.p1 GENE.GHVL01026528.1~~GHVL01026528.1.p1  ORF type:complete len:500 (+),score=113.76 GHVL01026528.1:16-1515(+)